ncbi:MAG: PadR family transcriptional regulator [Methanomicrobiaceae archaeon]|nr:PadR family transcriptional regulator [Methanomicrobiaceae archaeon]MDD5420274.1 PadR family transcriptional regulator [Methanomicrobiaceae archaeon]
MTQHPEEPVTADAINAALRSMRSSTKVKISDILILGLLSHRPMSGYDIYRFVEKKADASGSWLNLNKKTVYNTLGRMEDAGLVALHERVEEENRPPKSVYAVTEEGRERLRQLLRADAPSPPGIFVNYFLDLPFYGVLEEEEIIAILRDWLARLDALIELSGLYSTVLPDGAMKILAGSQTELMQAVRISIQQILERVQELGTEGFFSVGEIGEEELAAGLAAARRERSSP